MEQLINVREWPVERVLDMLLKDKTTKKNIIFATGGYFEKGREIDPKEQITRGALLGFDTNVIQPRVFKTAEEQSDRTKSHAEVFTPSWLCNKMNNHIDSEWFGRESVFNIEGEKSWQTKYEKIEFPDNLHWTDYVNNKRLEITCGEAPYLVSRYDTATGELIPVIERIGILDRKLRIVGENTEDINSWLEWTVKAYQATYGYEYQGDNLLIARINLLMTFVEYMRDRWDEDPTDEELKKIANIISWNIWQMDGLTGTVPLGSPIAQFELQTLDFFGEDEKVEEEKSEPCKIFDWKANKSVTYNSIKGER